MPNRRFKHKKPQAADNYNPPYSEEILLESVQVLSLREETANLLANAKITTLRDVLKREEKDFYRISTFNKKNLLDLKKALQVKKLELKPATERPQEQNAVKPQDKGNNNQPKANLQNKQALTEKKQTANIQQGAKKDNLQKNNQKDRYGTVDSPSFATILPEKPPRVVVTPEKEIPDIYVKVNKGGKWGFKDRNGNQKVAPLYDEVFNYKEDMCCVEKDELFGFINREGEEVIPIIYTCATSFSEGYACVFKRDKCGYINTNNEVIIDFKYDAGTPVIGGECRVKLDGRWGELHLDKPNEVRWIN